VFLSFKIVYVYFSAAKPQLLNLFQAVLEKIYFLAVLRICSRRPENCRKTAGALNELTLNGSFHFVEWTSGRKFWFPFKKALKSTSQLAYEGVFPYYINSNNQSDNPFLRFRRD